MLVLVAIGVAGAGVVFHFVRRAAPDAEFEPVIETVDAAHAAFDDLRYAEAESLFRHALRSRRVWYRPWDRSIVAGSETLRDLGVVLAAQGRYREAEEAIRRALRAQEKEGGPHGESLVLTLYRLGQLYEAMGRDSLARACAARIDTVARYVEPIYQSGVRVQRGIGRGDGRVLAERLAQLADLYYYTGRPDLAEPLYAEAYEIRARVFGPEDDRTTAVRTDLALASASVHKRSRALDLLREVLAIRERKHGPDSPRLINPMDHLATVLLWGGSYSEAESLSARVLAIQERSLGREHVTLTPTLGRLVQCRTELGNFQGARAAQTRVIGIDRRVFGPDSRQVGSDVLGLAVIENRAGERGRARKACKQALEILTRAAGSRDALTLECREAYEELSRPEKTAPRKGGADFTEGDWPQVG